MTDTTTTVLGLTKPEVGASTDSWGPKLNDNFDDIDALFTDPAKKMLKVANGGTGADTASGARTNLGLGSMATQGAGAVNITGGSIAGITDLALADGGTGASDAAGARTNLGLGALAVLSAIGASEITDGSVGTNELADSAVTLAKIAAAVQQYLVPAGSLMPYAGSSAPTGWLLCSGGTIGNATSGATARANADTATLYGLLWGAFTNTELPITDSSGTPTTRGANAAADFAVSKRLPLPDLRGRVIAGKDDMGGSSANRLTNQTGGLNGDTMGAAGGAETHTLTEAQMPLHGHPYRASYSTNSSAPSNTTGGLMTSLSSDSNQVAYTGTPSAAQGQQIGGTGGGGAHNNVQPTYILNYIVKY